MQQYKREVAMWLPREERDLLAHYYRTINEPNVRHSSKDPYELIDAIGYFRRLKRTCRKIKFWLRDKGFIPRRVDDEPRLDKVGAANERLQERKFICLDERDLMDVRVELTLQGWDLGRKYNNPLIRSGLWFKEYKDYWVWLIVGLIGGILGAIIVNKLSK